MEKYRIDQRKVLEFGLYTLGDHIPNPHTGERISAQQRIHEIIELAKLSRSKQELIFLVLVKVIKSILQHKHTRLF